jgi:hypothetical protein
MILQGEKGGASQSFLADNRQAKPNRPGDVERAGIHASSKNDVVAACPATCPLAQINAGPFQGECHYERKDTTMKTHFWITVAMLSVLAVTFDALSLPPAVVVQKDQSDKGKVESPPTIQTILDWLPADTETLVVCNGPFQLEESNDEDRKALPLAKYLEGFSYLPLGTPRDGIKKLAGQEVAIAVEGARNFRGPKQLGMCLYDGCHVLVFRRDLGTAGDSLRKALGSGAIKVKKIAGHDVFCFEEKWEQDLWKFFFAQPKPNVLLCATDQGYLTEMLQRMDQGGKKRALPDSLPEWKHVDMNARFWAIRHYGKPREIEHADSPLSIDPKAVGLTFSFTPGKKPGGKDSPRIKYLSANENAEKIATKAWTYFDQPKWRPTVQKSGPGVVEITVSFDQEQSPEFLFLLLFHLGHGIAV